MAGPESPSPGDAGSPNAGVETCAPDCAERTSCPVVGEPGHWQCGTCPKHDRPRHHCGCLAVPPAENPALAAEAVASVELDEPGSGGAYTARAPRQSPEDTVEPYGRCYSTGSGCCGRPGEACAVHPVHGATPPAPRTGEDDEAVPAPPLGSLLAEHDGEPAARTREDDEADVVARIETVISDTAYAARDDGVMVVDVDDVRAALPARPLVSGTDEAAENELMVAAYRSGYEDGVTAESRRTFFHRPGAPLVSGTVNRDDVARELARHQHLMGRRDDDQPQWFSWCECGWDGGPVEPSRGAPVDVRMAFRLHVADELLALLGGDQAAGLTETKETDR